MDGAIKEAAEALPALPTVLMTARDERPSAGPVAVKGRKANSRGGRDSGERPDAHRSHSPSSRFHFPETFLNTEDNTGQSSKSLRFVMQ